MTFMDIGVIIGVIILGLVIVAFFALLFYLSAKAEKDPQYLEHLMRDLLSGRDKKSDGN